MSALSGSSVFISYRRDDTAANAGRLYDHLSNHFGEDNVFMDIDTIATGSDFTEAIRDALSRCNVMFVLIGRNWLSITDNSGRRRLDNPGDFVRLEIETAVRRGIRMVPVLIDGAEPPMAKDLPLSLQPLIKYQALQLTNIGFRSQVTRLLAVAEEAGTPVNPAQASLARWHLELLRDEGSKKKTFRLWTARESHEITVAYGKSLEIDGSYQGGFVNQVYNTWPLPHERTGLGFDMTIKVVGKFFERIGSIEVKIGDQVLKYKV
jgi:hypothetical protein